MEIDIMIKEGKKILIANNNIYDVSDFDHPFNITPFDNKIGTDVSIDYNFHSKESKKIWEKYKIGQLKSDWCTIC
jgi:cytochrome b involved in lipid metabolism